ncbi:hypothetical protein D3C71_1756810 [compost metagenome]
MIQRKLIANHRPQVRAVAPDHPVAVSRFTNESPGEQLATAVGAIEQVASAIGLAWLQSSGPGVITHTVHFFRPVPAPGLGQPLWITLVEQRHAFGGEGMMGRMNIHRQLGPVIAGVQQAHQRVDHAQQKAQ